MTSPLEEFKKSREELFDRFAEGAIAEAFLEDYTEVVDQYFRRSLQESSTGLRLFGGKNPFTLVALGGYGRRELCYRSDLDIMILFKDRIPPKAVSLAEEFLYPLWDLGIDIGHAFRTLRDCSVLAGKDFQVLTSLIDARFVGGDSPLFLNFTEKLWSRVAPKRTVRFLKWLEEKTDERMTTFGDASYLLEPNLKEGIGGLRDYHTMLWLAGLFFHARVPRDLEYSGALSHAEYESLKVHLRFIWLVRNHLHRLCGRKNDRLYFEYQPRIAKHMGFQDTTDLLAVESFLGRLHSSMATVKSLCRSFLHSHLPDQLRPSGKKVPPRSISPGLVLDHGEICFEKVTGILSKPLLLMEAFETSARLAFPLSLESKRLVKEFLYLVNDAYRESEESVRLFLDVFKGKSTFEALDQMLETGFLEAFIPEFRQIRDHIQFDTYHVFPVGRHALQTINNLKHLQSEKDFLFLDILADLSDPEPLYLAALFHDIGKGRRDHSAIGAKITGSILRRFGYDKKRSNDILFLVKHHILLAKTATRRDLNHEKAVVHCARTIGNSARLKMLYLLTWADSRATGPRAWNEWIANLVQELFFKLLHILERGELATPTADRRTKKTLAEVRHHLSFGIDPPELDRLLNALSLRYLLEIPSARIAHHLDLVHGLGEDFRDPGSRDFYLETREEPAEGCWEVTVLAKDRPGLFSDIAGVFALNNINILSAHIYTWEDGTAADVFRVTPPLDPLHPEETWERVRKELRGTLLGVLPLAERLKEKTRPSLLHRPRASHRKPRVTVDNVSSDFFSLIEVFADDRLGLLHEITRRLFELGVTIQIAKVATKVDQIADIFYVRDQEGRKLMDKRKIDAIKQALLKVVETV